MYRGYTANAVEEQKQPVPLQIFHLGGQRKEKHNNHIMVGSIMNRRAAIFFTNTRHKGGNFFYLMEVLFGFSHTDQSSFVDCSQNC